MVSDQQLVLIVYLLYLAAYIFGITALVGVIIAYARFPEVNRLLHTHCQFQIRTFWIGLLYLVVAGFLAYASFPVIGVAVLIWWLVWSLIRNTNGLLALNENKPIQEPTSLDVWTPTRPSLLAAPAYLRKTSAGVGFEGQCSILR
jgi:uncharacterized membrane protein